VSYFYYACEQSIGEMSEHTASDWGFRFGERGTHTSRTIMLDELTLLLRAASRRASRDEYARAVVVENCLGKETASNRELTWRRLRELYGLDQKIQLFRIFRDLWLRDQYDHALLSLLLALARDPLLRATAPAVLDTPFGHEFARQQMKDALADVVGERFNSNTLDKVVRNAASSWTQSGHLKGRGRKTRQQVEVTPVTVAYAVLLGYATGRRGHLLFETPWCAVLDADAGRLIELAWAAKRIGLLDLKQSGSIIDVSFPAMLTRGAREWSHGAY